MRRGLVSALALVLLPGAAQALPKFKRCDDEAKRNIRAAVEFLDRNMKTLKRDFEFGTRLPRKKKRIHRRMGRKLGKLRFSCGRGRRLCRDSKDVVGFHALGSASRKLLICYDKIDNRSTSDFCELVGVIAHEYGHAVGIPKQRAGRHHKNGNDRVYQFGWFARDLCRAQGVDRRLASPPKRARPVSARTGLLVYPKASFRGAPRHFAAGTSRDDVMCMGRWTRAGDNLRCIGRRNSISSLRLLSGRWEACTKPHFKGWCYTFDRSVGNLKRINWSNRINSIRPAPHRRDGLVLYKAYGYRGAYQHIVEDVSHLKRLKANNDASSLRVLSGTWEVCAKGRYRGRCRVVSADVPNLKRIKLNNTISSVRRTAAGGAPAACRRHPILFSKSGYRGKQRKATTDLPNLGKVGFNNKASSLCVPDGWRVELYYKKRFRKTPLVLEGPARIDRLKDRRRKRRKNWNNAISSLRVERH